MGILNNPPRLWCWGVLIGAMVAGCAHSPALAPNDSFAGVSDSGSIAMTDTEAQSSMIVSAPKMVSEFVAADGLQVPVTEASFNYRIGVGDLLLIQVFPDEEFKHEIRVDIAGTVNLPLLGRVKLAGDTLENASKKLEQMLPDGFYKHPTVLLQVREYYSSQVAVLGAVRKPDMVPIFRRTTVLDALGAVGGFEEGASRRLVIVRRDSDQRDQVITIDVAAIVERGDMNQNIEVLPGDTMFAPNLEQVFVYGQVKQPGAFDFGTGITLLRAIAQASGLTEVANRSRIEILRTTGGQSARRRIDLDEVIDGTIDDPLLRSDDVIVVPERFF